MATDFLTQKNLISTLASFHSRRHHIEPFHITATHQ
jgi:hypothetical protein